MIDQSVGFSLQSFYLLNYILLDKPKEFDFSWEELNITLIVFIIGYYYTVSVSESYVQISVLWVIF